MEPARTSHRQLVGGRYSVEHLLGEGGMGAVYQVLDEGSGQRLALKRLHGAPNDQQAELFEREYRTLSSLRHGRIVKVFEYGVDQGSAYYTMELLEGGDLSKRAPMPWRAVCACLRDAASVLGVLHSRRLVHRDLNPRNLWRTCDGRLKLLDFGALSPFGPAPEIVGTPAFVAPEALRGAPLDQRTDLFSLGALGYWLLTSVHAYRASQLAELPRVWTKLPAPPSSLARLVEGADQDIPEALDRLIEALLRLDADERPRDTAEVIDRLNAIADLVPEAQDVVVEGYLDSKAFVGRAQERDRAARALSRASRGKPEALSIEGTDGLGKSRLLTELATAAHISGATVISAGAEDSDQPYGTAIALARGLLRALPHEARAAARPHAAVLAGLAPELRSLLELPSQPTAALSALEERSRRQTALAAWLLTLAEKRTLVLVVDDFLAVDEETQALMATLSRAPQGHRLLLVCSVASDALHSQPATVRGFTTSARKLRLPPLSADEVRDLLRSVFGEVPYLARVAAWLHQLAEGSPGHILMLARHLVREGIARYAEGAWTLPTELPTGLPSTLRGTLLASLESVPDEARQLLRLLSLHEGALARPMLCALLDTTHEATEAAITLLLEQRLLRESGAGLSLAHTSMSDSLSAELSSDMRLHAHHTLGTLFEREGELLSQVHSGLHYLKARQLGLGHARLMVASRRIMAGEHETLRTAAALFEEALRLLREGGCDHYAELPLLSVLAVSGYQVDRSYAARYGEESVNALQRALRFGLARRLRPFVGGLPSLLVALLVTMVSMRVRRSATRPLEAITWLITVIGYLMGPAAMSLDHARLRRFARVLEPLLALGGDHAVAMVHGFCRALMVSLEDRSAQAQHLLAKVIDRLNQPGPIRGLPEANRRNLLFATYYTYGTRETFACDEHVLSTASALEAGTPMHALQADQLRAIHYAYRGEQTLASQFEHCVELKAIQLGTAWQAELVAPRHLSRIALWTHDVATHKRALSALQSLAEEFPSFAGAARRAQGADLVLRGEYRDALLLLEVDEEPQAELGWVATRALLATAYNGLNEYAKAKAVCVEALSRLSDDDRNFVIQNLQAEAELALAEAGLGAFDVAQQSLLGLLEKHALRGPLVAGYLHRVLFRAALFAGNTELAERHLDAMEQCYRPTRIPSLLILSVELRQLMRRAHGPQTLPDAPLAADDVHLLTRVELMMRTASNDTEDRSGYSALQVALSLTGADRGAILYPDTVSPGVAVGPLPHEDVIAWAKDHLSAAADEDGRTATLWDGDLGDAEGAERCFGPVAYSVSVLWRVQGHVERAVAALVLGFPTGRPAQPPPAVLRVMGERLLRSQRG